jgi:hypothetical protein
VVFVGSIVALFQTVFGCRFDANWAFSIPPPNEPYGGSGDGNNWQGMSNRVWGSHVYYSTVAMYNALNPNRSHTMPAQRTVTLTK